MLYTEVQNAWKKGYRGRVVDSNGEMMDCTDMGIVWAYDGSFVFPTKDVLEDDTYNFVQPLKEC